MGRTKPLDPLDEGDPRVQVEFVDKFGQTIKPGDLVFVGGYRRQIHIARVETIMKLRRDFRPFTWRGDAVSPVFELQDMVQSTLELRERPVQKWNPDTRNIEDTGEIRKVCWYERHPTWSCVKAVITK